MRLLVPLLVAALLAGACGSEKLQSNAKSSPTPAAQTFIVKDLILTDAEVPGCTLDKEGESVVKAISQSFNCGPNGSSDERITNFVSLNETTPADAERIVSNAWSTLDAATEQIRQQVNPRPIDPNSVKVTNVKDAFGKIGADQEYVWCATFTDVGHTVQLVMYFGAFRHKNIRVYWTSQSFGGDCSGDSRAEQLGRLVAKAQLAKLKAIAPQGAVLPSTPSPSPGPAGGPPATPRQPSPAPSRTP